LLAGITMFANGNRVALHFVGQMNRVSGMHRQQCEVLVRDIEHLTVRDENALAARLDTSLRAVPIGHARVRGDHFRMARIDEEAA
jgi:hypothetical protein